MTPSYRSRTYTDATEYFPLDALATRDKYAVKGAELTNCSTGDGGSCRSCNLRTLKALK